MVIKHINLFALFIIIQTYKDFYGINDRNFTSLDLLVILFLVDKIYF